MTARRPIAFATLALAATGLLAGCSTPPERITIQSGATSIWVPPAADCTGNTAYAKAGDCGDNGSTGPLLVLHNNRLAIGVPVSVAKNLWFVSAGNGQTTPTSSTYQSFDGLQASNPTTVEVHEVKSPTTSSTVWRFRIVSG